MEFSSQKWIWVDMGNFLSKNPDMDGYGSRRMGWSGVGLRTLLREGLYPSALFRPCLRPSERVPARSVPSKPPPAAAGGGFDGTERATTRSDGRKQGRNSTDGCGEDRASLPARRSDPSCGRSGAAAAARGVAIKASKSVASNLRNVQNRCIQCS